MWYQICPMIIDLGFRIQNHHFVNGLGFRIQNHHFVNGLGFRIQNRHCAFDMTLVSICFMFILWS
jgi:hypothetical protein